MQKPGAERQPRDRDDLIDALALVDCADLNCETPEEQGCVNQLKWFWMMQFLQMVLLKRNLLLLLQLSRSLN
jgi:hypothetical protein